MNHFLRNPVNKKNLPKENKTLQGSGKKSYVNQKLLITHPAVHIGQIYTIYLFKDVHKRSLYKQNTTIQQL